MSIARHAVLVPAILFAGCVTKVVEKERIDPEILAQHENRLLQQFRGGHVIVCQTLYLEANGFLFNNNLVLPAGKPVRHAGDGFEEYSWSMKDEIRLRPGGPGAKPGWDAKGRAVPRASRLDKFKIMIGSTAFMVDDRIVVRRLLRAPPTLTAHAKGHVMVIRDGKDASTFREVRFVDGRVEAK